MLKLGFLHQLSCKIANTCSNIIVKCDLISQVYVHRQVYFSFCKYVNVCIYILSTNTAAIIKEISARRFSDSQGPP